MSWNYFWVCLCVYVCVHITEVSHMHKVHISTYTGPSNTITSGCWLLENHLKLSSLQSWQRAGRFPSNIKGEVASIPAFLHLSPVYSNHTLAVSSAAFILLDFSISLFCFSPDRDWISSAPGEQSYESNVLFTLNCIMGCVHVCGTL